MWGGGSVIAGRGNGRGVEQGAQGVEADHVVGLEVDVVSRQGTQRGGHIGEGGLFAAVHRAGQWVGVVGRLGHDGVDDDVLAVHPECGQFGMGAVDFTQRRAGRAAHQHQAGAVGIGQRGDRGGVGALLLVQARERAQTRSVTLAGVEELCPVPGQLQQPDGVPGGGGVEQDVIEAGDGAVAVGEQGGELIEGGHLGGARAGELFGDGGDLGLGQQPAHRADDAFAVVRRGGLGVDLQGRQSRHGGDRGDGVADGDPEDLPHIGGRVGRHQQHALAGADKRQGSRAGDRGLADPALAGEEQEPRRVGEERQVSGRHSGKTSSRRESLGCAMCVSSSPNHRSTTTIRRPRTGRG